MVGSPVDDRTKIADEEAHAVSEKLNGIIIPAVTPFDPAERLSLSMLEANLGRWNDTPVRGYMCLGSNGESRSLSDDESVAVAGATLRLKRDKTLIVGIGRESLRLTLDFLARIVDLGEGIDYVSVLTPHYFRRSMTDDALLDYYTAVADRSPIPVLIYGAPAFANSVVISPAVVKVLADHPNIHGIKDNSADMVVEYLSEVGDREDFAVLAGSLPTLMACLAFGGSGGVVSAANYLPRECARITDLYFSGRREEAFAQLVDLQRVVKRTGGRHSIAGVKSCMTILGYAGGVPRLPVKPLAASVEDQMRKVLLDLPRTAG